MSSQVLIDSGTSFLILPPQLIVALERKLSHVKVIKQGQAFYFPCGEDDLLTYPSITYYTKGLAFNVTARSYLYLSSAIEVDNKYYCLPGIISTQLVPLHILGDSFFRESFVTFSKRNQTMGIYV